MSERTGLGLVEVLVLQTLADLDARPDRPHQKSARIIEEVRVRHDVSHDFAWDALCRMTSDWLVPVRLVDGHGNFGSPDFGPAAPRYNEVRLTAAGLLAVECEAGAHPMLPLGLINGDMCVGGSRPSFDPVRVVTALARAIEEPRLDDEQLAALVGPPAFPTGCAVSGDLDALHAGESTRTRMAARVTVETAANRTVLVIDQLPLGVGAAEVAHAVAGRSQRYEGHDDVLPFTDVWDESRRDATRIVCALRAGADPSDAVRRLVDVWPVSVERVLRLDAPLGTLVRRLVDDDRRAQAEALEVLLRAIRRDG